jgi:hypothetical protein
MYTDNPMELIFLGLLAIPAVLALMGYVLDYYLALKK